MSTCGSRVSVEPMSYDSIFSRATAGEVPGITHRWRAGHNVTGKSICLILGDPRDDGRPEKHSAAPANENRLAASFAHEINNPLQSLVNLLHLMGEEEATLTDEVRHYLTLAREEANRISQIARAAMNGFG